MWYMYRQHARHLNHTGCMLLVSLYLFKIQFFYLFNYSYFEIKSSFKDLLDESSKKMLPAGKHTPTLESDVQCFRSILHETLKEPVRRAGVGFFANS
jgi:hypothetical protein